MKRKDWMIILGVLVLAGAVFLFARYTQKPVAHTDGTQGIDGATITFDKQELSMLFQFAAQAEATPEQAEDAEAGAADAVEPESYVCIWVGQQYQLFPLTEEGLLTLKQSDDMVNVVGITKNGFHMESSTCDNQDCVQQGEVTLDNREERILFNWVVCLPNQVMLELLSAEEAKELLAQSEPIG